MGEAVINPGPENPTVAPRGEASVRPTTFYGNDMIETMYASAADPIKCLTAELETQCAVAIGCREESN